MSLKKVIQRVLLVGISLTLPLNNLLADEGMWLPLLLKDQRYAQMRLQGLQLSAEEIYAVNQACLSNAVIGLMGEGSNFKSFCTASFVSREGLIITNYHCVMSYLERFSNEGNDFLKHGYWANNLPEETNCYKLMAKQLVRMEDVTNLMVEGTEGLSGIQLTNKVNDNGKRIADSLTRGTDLQAHMQAMFSGNQYVLSIYRVFEDIRMVAAPPTALGRFGGNEDNWRWPRHTADFAILRVYSTADNKPAKYKKENVPYRPDAYLQVSETGVKEDDFVMMLGYPGSSRLYVPAHGVEGILYRENTARITLAGEKLAVMQQAVKENPELRFRYFSRMSSVANTYLRMKGELSGADRMGIMSVKQAQEEEFRQWAAQDPLSRSRYVEALDQMDSLYKTLSVFNLGYDYFLDAGITGSEIVPFIGKFEKLAGMFRRAKVSQSAVKSESRRLVGLTHQFFNNWDYEIDRKMFRNVMLQYWNNQPRQFIPPYMTECVEQFGGNLEELSQSVFAGSIFTDKEALLEFLENDKPGIEIITEDPLYRLAIGYYQVNVDLIARQRGQMQARQAELYKVYLEGVLAMNAGKALYPDANSSLRIGYGKVSGAAPSDGLIYTYSTTLGGMYDKYVMEPGNEDFYMPAKLRRLHDEQDYGRFTNDQGTVNVCFLSSCHTTSGSSGSPVVDAKGRLVGLNFDRIYQGVASDYLYNDDLCRNICVDIRFILFLLDKYCPNDYVLEQLDIAGR